MKKDNIRRSKVINGKDIKWEFKKTEDGINHLVMHGAVRDKDTKSVIRRRNVDWYWRPTEDEEGNNKGFNNYEFLHKQKIKARKK